MSRLHVAVLWAIALSAWPLVAEAKEPLVTDRPDIAEASDVVGGGVYQIEQAFQNEHAAGANTQLLPSLHRFGVTDRLELRMETPLVSLQAGKPSFDALAVGFKYRLRDGGGLGEWPSASLLAHGNLTSSGGVEPIAKLLLDTTLPLETDLGVNLGASWAPGASAPTLTGAVAVWHDLVAPLSAYGELAAEHDAGAGQTAAGVDGGLAYLINDDMQLDVALYKGLTPGTADWYVTTGISARFGAR